MKVSLLSVAFAAILVNGTFADEFQGTIIMTNGDEIFSGCNCRDDWLFLDNDIYVKQKQNGNLVVRTGSPGDSTLVWSSNVDGAKGDYNTRFQNDGNILTREGTNKSGDIAWKSRTAAEKGGDYFFGLIEDLQFLQVWKGTSDNPEKLLLDIQTKLYDSSSLPEPEPEPEPEPTLLALLEDRSDEFSTFINAIEGAGLKSSFSDAALDWTVFAPTNDAFDSVLPFGLLDKYFEPEWNGVHLKILLQYHYLYDQILTSDELLGYQDGAIVKENSGLVPDPVFYTSDPPRLSSAGTPNDAEITEVDILASNGIAHVVNQVLIGVSAFRADPISTAIATGLFETFVELVEIAGLTDFFQTSSGPTTYFVPPDAVFAAVPEATLDCLATNPEVLKNVLMNHVVEGTFLDCGCGASGVVAQNLTSMHICF